MTIPPVTMAELKKHLNLAPNTSADDAELQLHLEAATEAVEERVGPLVTRQFTQRVDGRGGSVVLDHTPVVDVTDLTEVVSSYSWLPVEYDVDAASGVVTGALGRRLPRGAYTVTYTAGRGLASADPVPDGVVPAKYRLAVLYVTEHLWEMQRKGASRPSLMGEAGNTAASTGEAGARYVYRGFALPNRALELLAGEEELGFR